MKSVETTTVLCFSNSDCPHSRARSSRGTVDARMSSASMPNFDRSSSCHCSASAGEQSTAKPAASPWARSSVAISPDSTVFPTPTSLQIAMRTVS